MKKSRALVNDDAVHPTKLMNRLDKPENELKDVKIDATLMITSNDQNMNTWFGFVSEGALFLKGNGWDSTDIREVSNFFFIVLSFGGAPGWRYDS